MLIACKCLNISIDVKGAEFRMLKLSALNLSPIEESDDFFKENLCEAETASIKRQVESLARSRTVGRYLVVQCLNCCLQCYATHGGGATLVSAALITDPSTVLRLQALADYSPGFRIILKPSAAESGGTVVPKLKTGLTTSLQTALTALQQQLTSVMQDQVAKTEEQVRLFSEQQFVQLEVFRERTHKDYNALVKMVYNIHANAQDKSREGERQAQATKPGMGITTPPTTPPSPIAANGSSPVTSFQGVAQKRLSARSKTEIMGSSARRQPPLRSLSLYTPNKAAGSLDTEGLFDLEGMEDQTTEPYHSECESDTDHDDSGSHDEGIDLHRKRASSISLAKSLPVNVPVYPTTNFRVSDLDPDDQEYATETMDIAASIKALARSVHGDAVFGELPRPRFSTHM